jgi:hypothetical protein
VKALLRCVLQTGAFDLMNDPAESQNVISAPGNSAVLEQLSGKLHLANGVKSARVIRYEEYDEISKIYTR